MCVGEAMTDEEKREFDALKAQLKDAEKRLETQSKAAEARRSKEEAEALKAKDAELASAVERAAKAEQELVKLQATAKLDRIKSAVTKAAAEKGLQYTQLVGTHFSLEGFDEGKDGQVTGLERIDEWKKTSPAEWFGGGKTTGSPREPGAGSAPARTGESGDSLERAGFEAMRALESPSLGFEAATEKK